MAESAATRRQSLAPPPSSAGPAGQFVQRGAETWYAIDAPQELRPFLVSLASDCDLWMFVTSRGGLTCGRVDAEGALFPYLTVDRLHDAHLHTGPLTLLRVPGPDGEPVLWQPFAQSHDRDASLSRSLEKNTAGNRLAWRESHHELGLELRAEWAPSEKFGWVRTVTLTNHRETEVTVEVLDGLRNLLPSGVPLGLSQQASNLVEAYCVAEVDPQTNLGVFSLTAAITDRAEAVEMLRANAVWCEGPEHPRLHLNADCIERFRAGAVLAPDVAQQGGRGHFFADFSCELAAGETSEWRLVGEVGLDQCQLAALRREISTGGIGAAVREDLARSQRTLQQLVAAADGRQLTNDPGAWAHHYANTLFNVMRGGTFADNNRGPRDDFQSYLAAHNCEVVQRQAGFLSALPETVDCTALVRSAETTGDVNLERLALEYLPLQFGRRHGDPSRPWNAFSVRVRDEAGHPLLHYEGNWRDIFQNWEALGGAYPRFLPHMVARFLNATTADGFNPYRLNSEGLEWEVADPDDSWSNIGYWGDHQIVYLTRLLAAWERHDPDGILEMLSREIFSYAEVPYYLKSHREILADPARSIVFDSERHEAIMRRAEGEGSDGKLLHDAEGRVVHVSLLEKLLVPVLTKLSSLVPDGGIWMNTQRPEWNDANNALAGWGLSVVTMAHLRRHLVFLSSVLERTPNIDCRVSEVVADWLAAVATVFGAEAAERDASFRGRFLDGVGQAFETYRTQVYAQGMKGRRVVVSTAQAAAFLHTALAEVDRSLAANRRSDGLYHAYNILQPEAAGAGLGLSRLPKMLEGQVAVLGAGILGEEETLTALESLFASDLYCAEQRSFLLYPRRDVPGFLARNRIPAAAISGLDLLRRDLSEGGGRLVVRDVDQTLRFAPDLARRADVEAALAALAADPAWTEAVRADRQAVLDVYEDVFQHRSFTGRSGTMFGYEGIGCIYWHMVAKLLLAVQESLARGRREGWSATALATMGEMYFRIREGLGYRKTAAEFGAFPMDPYSHTPADGGARQPGMTGQVKEEILTRRGELGVSVVDRALVFAPRLLQRDEFLTAPDEFRTLDVDGRSRALPLEKGELAFTICQTPIIYRLVDGDATSLEISLETGETLSVAGSCLGGALSGEIFDRSGRIDLVRVMIPAASLDPA